MNGYDFVHLSFLAVGGDINGKTKLQKTVYFLGVMTDALPDLGYRAHFYGPYSQEVTDAVSRLRSLHFVDQNVVRIGAADAGGFEVARFDFHLNERGKSVAERKAQRNPAIWQKLGSAAKALRTAGDRDYMKLSIAAKTYFMLDEKKGTATAEELARLAKRFGWSVSGDEVREAAAFLQHIGLVKIGKDG